MLVPFFLKLVKGRIHLHFASEYNLNGHTQFEKLYENYACILSIQLFKVNDP